MIKRIPFVAALILFIGASKFLGAQEIKSFSDFSPEIQARANENKSAGKPLFQGINFRYDITIMSNYKDTYASNATLEDVLNQLKIFFNLDKYSYKISDKGELLLVFELQNHYSYDDLKIKLTELKLYMLAINLTVSLK